MTMDLNQMEFNFVLEQIDVWFFSLDKVALGRIKCYKFTIFCFHLNDNFSHQTHLLFRYLYGSFHSISHMVSFVNVSRIVDIA